MDPRGRPPGGTECQRSVVGDTTVLKNSFGLAKVVVPAGSSSRQYRDLLTNDAIKYERNPSQRLSKSPGSALSEEPGRQLIEPDFSI